MPEHLRALVVILVLAVGVFAIAKSPVCRLGMLPADFLRRRNFWLAVTAAGFLANNFWLYVLAVGALLAIAASKEANKPALFFFMLFALPKAVTDRIPGLGLMNYVADVDYVRLLIVFVLFPAFWRLRQQPGTPSFGRLAPDKFLAGYMILVAGLILSVGTFTNTLRAGVVYAFIDIFLPYYVASRALKSVEDFRDALLGFVVAGLLLSAIGIFEAGRHSLLYSSLPGALGVSTSEMAYLERGEGALRAQASTGHAIPLGYALAVILAIYLYFKKAAGSSPLWYLGLLLLALGLVAPLSRGPWLGAALVILLMAATGPTPAKDFGKLALVGAILLPIVMSTSTGEKILELLPFLGGEVAEHTITYRERLLETSLDLFGRNPIFGAFDYIYSPEMQELRQGQGIVNIVNTYIAIGLGSGVVGLSLFTGFFAVVAAGIFRAMRAIKDRGDERYRLGQALLVALVAIVVMIATVSSVSIIPVVYWSIAGLGVAYVQMMKAAPVPESPAGEVGRIGRNPCPPPLPVRRSA